MNDNNNDVNQKKTKMLEETPGVTSSKRVMGTVSIICGILLLLFVGIAAIFRKEEIVNASTALDAGGMLVGIGASLLGITVLEHFGNK